MRILYLSPEGQTDILTNPVFFIAYYINKYIRFATFRKDNSRYFL